MGVKGGAGKLNQKLNEASGCHEALHITKYMELM